MPSGTLSNKGSQLDELIDYLQEGESFIPPCSVTYRQFNLSSDCVASAWGRTEKSKHEYPVLSCLARDVLSVPATGAGLERLFK